MTQSAAPAPAYRRLATPAARWVGLAIAAGILLAILGPFGSYMNGGPARLVGYWVGAMLLGLMLYGTAYKVARRTAPVGSRRWWTVLVGAAVVASIPEAVATRAAAFWLWPDVSRLGLSFSVWFVQTATIGLIATVGVGLVRRLGARLPDVDPAAPRSITPTVRPLVGEVLALQMEDHYVRVHRPTGSELVLLPLSHAIAAVSGEGLRTHRSWWVAAHAVAAVEGDARSMRLRLSNGLYAPVARSAVTRLKAAGWIKDDVRTLGGSDSDG